MRWFKELVILVMLAGSVCGQRSFLVADSGPQINPSNSTQVVWSQQLNDRTAQSVRAVFGILELAGDEDAVIVTSLQDGEQHVIDQSQAKYWSNRSAWMNGFGVMVELRLGPGSSGRVGVSGLQQPLVPGTRNDICGSDNRVPSADPRVCRLVSSASSLGGGCSGFLVSDQNTVLSAGHCAPAGVLMVAEFNVPASNIFGQINHPPVADQYPVDQGSLIVDNNGVGDDWAVMRLHPNAFGQTASSRQGAPFTLATSVPTPLPPFSTPNVRVTGYGADMTPSATRNQTQQSDAGSLVLRTGNELRYSVDTEGGVSGGPVILSSSGEVIGIHNAGGCSIPLVGTNAATSILNSQLQAAISTVSGCTSFTPAEGVSQLAPCTNAVFTIQPVQSRWNVVGVSSTSDWDVQIDGASSAFGGATCDFVVANGHAGNLPPRSGRVNRFSGGAQGRFEWDAALPVTPDSNISLIWPVGSAVRAYEFNITNAGAYDISVTGSSQLRWRVLSPQSGAAWQSRNTANTILQRTMGDPAATTSLGVGWHCLLVYSDSGPVNPPVANFTVSICQSAPSVSLVANQSRVITADCQPFTTALAGNSWHVVGVSSPSNWDLLLGAGSTSLFGVCDFVLADGALGTPNPVSGSAVRASGTDPATLVYATPTAMAPGSPADTILPAGEILRAFSLLVPSSGNYNVQVTGGIGLRWRIYGQASNAEWRPRASSLANGTGAAGPATLSLSAGRHLLVVFRDGGAPMTAVPFTAHVCSTASSIALGYGSTAFVGSNGCNDFSMSPRFNQWNVVGVLGTSGDWDIAMGATESQSGGTTCDYLVSNGRLGLPSPTSGLVSRFSGSGSGELSHGMVTTLSGTNLSFGQSWPSTALVRVYEFEVTQAGDYDLTVTASAPMLWSLFTPGISVGWRPRNTGAFTQSTSPVARVVTLSTGWHAVVVYRNSAAFSGNMGLSINPRQPLPVLNSVTPTTVQTGSGSFLLTCNGSGFTPSSGVRVGGLFVNPVNFINTSQVRVTVPSFLISAAGPLSVEVVNPGPGGGASAQRNIAVNNPAPAIASLSPSTATVGGSGLTLSVFGSGFVANSQVVWGGSVLPTTYVSGGRLDATVGAAQLVNAAVVDVRVSTPTPGGGVSASRPFTVAYPQPTIVAVSPNSAAAGSPATSITCTGTGFVSASQVRFSGVNIPTTFVSATTLTAVIPATSLVNPAARTVSVFNPAPGGGGTVVNQSFSVTQAVPVLSMLTPSRVVANGPAFTLQIDGAGFNASTIVRWNGLDLPVSFVSSTRLNAQVAAVRISSAGSASIRVINAPPGGGVSAAGAVIIDPFGLPSALSFLSAPTSTVAMASMTPPVRVFPVDSFGNQVLGFNFNATASLTGPGGSLLGTTTVASEQGVATFADLSIDQAGQGYQISVAATGLASVLSGSFSIFPAGMADLYSVQGATAGDRFGETVASLGDVNNDGFSDYVVGAPGHDGVGADSGRVTLHSGVDGSVLFQWLGQFGGDQLGRSVAGVLDADGDGVPDIVAGAPFNDDTANDAGAVYLWSGASGLVIQEWRGQNAGDHFGAAVSGLGDIDSDGMSDVAVGIPDRDSAGFDAGEVRVFSSATSMLFQAIAGQVAQDRFGSSIANAGDVNGDGFADVLVGAPGHDANGVDSGLAQVWDVQSLNPLLDVPGQSAGDRLGAAVASAGDIDGDGIPELLVGAPMASGITLNSGVVYVLAGSDGSQLRSLSGGSSGDGFGSAVAGGLDLDGDGIADAVVGAPMDDDAGPDSGSVSIWSALTGQQLSLRAGDAAGDRLGTSVASALDIDGDGVNDALAGAPLNDSAGASSGRVWVLSGLGSRRAATTLLGEGCWSTPRPRLTLSANSFLGVTTYLVLENAPPGAVATLFISSPLVGAPLVFGGGASGGEPCAIWLNLANYFTWTSATIGANGTWIIPSNVPADPAFAGFTYTGQIGFFPPTGGAGVSNGVLLTWGF